MSVEARRNQSPLPASAERETTSAAPERAAEVGAALRRLVEHLRRTEWRDLPRGVQRRGAIVLVDDLAAMVAPRDEPELAALQEGVARVAGLCEATVFNGKGVRLDRYSAALANGCAGDWAELDEGYRKAICHAGVYCLPALLAEAEATQKDGYEVLRALVLGYEVAARVARCFTFPNLVLHPHGSLAAVGAAAAVAFLRRVPADHAVAAISAAATMVSPGPYTHPIDGSLVRNVWPGVAAQTGLRAVDWAGIGIAGLPSALHDVYADAFGATPDPAALGGGLGDAWAIEDGYHKVFACCQYGHATIEATIKLLKRAAQERVRHIRLETHYKARVMDNPDPPTTIGAKFSMQHIAATAAVHGGGGAEAFSTAALADPRVAELRHVVEIAAWEPVPAWPNDRPTRVIWELDDGERLSEEVMSARGGPDLPFSPAEIGAKARGLVAQAYPKMPAVLDAFLALDPDVMSRSWDGVIAEIAG